MIRLAVTLVLASLTVAPAVAQVINGETPLDETTLNRRTPGPAAAAATNRATPPDVSPAKRRAPDAAPTPADPRRD